MIRYFGTRRKICKVHFRNIHRLRGDFVAVLSPPQPGRSYTYAVRRAAKNSLGIFGLGDSFKFRTPNPPSTTLPPYLRTVPHIRERPRRSLASGRPSSVPFYVAGSIHAAAFGSGPAPETNSLRLTPMQSQPDGKP